MYESSPTDASKFFEDTYSLQLNSFHKDLLQQVKTSKKNIQDLLPFQEGDTLASWERSKNSHYRNKVAKFLETLGYEISNN